MEPDGITPRPRGGVTIVARPAAGLWVFGAAVCSPDDGFNRKRGLAIARGRAHKPDIHVRGCVANSAMSLEMSMTEEALRRYHDVLTRHGFRPGSVELFLEMGSLALHRGKPRKERT